MSNRVIDYNSEGIRGEDLYPNGKRTPILKRREGMENAPAYVPSWQNNLLNIVENVFFRIIGYGLFYVFCFAIYRTLWLKFNVAGWAYDMKDNAFFHFVYPLLFAVCLVGSAICFRLIWKKGQQNNDPLDLFHLNKCSSRACVWKRWLAAILAVVCIGLVILLVWGLYYAGVEIYKLWYPE